MRFFLEVISLVVITGLTNKLIKSIAELTASRTQKSLRLLEKILYASLVISIVLMIIGLISYSILDPVDELILLIPLILIAINVVVLLAVDYLQWKNEKEKRSITDSIIQKMVKASYEELQENPFLQALKHITSPKYYHRLNRNHFWEIWKPNLQDRVIDYRLLPKGVIKSRLEFLDNMIINVGFSILVGLTLFVLSKFDVLVPVVLEFTFYNIVVSAIILVSTFLIIFLVFFVPLRYVGLSREIGFWLFEFRDENWSPLGVKELSLLTTGVQKKDVDSSIEKDSH